MPRNYLVLFLMITFFIGGCATSNDVKVKAYKQDKVRVDQEIVETAPVGNWQNAPRALNPDRKPTRKVYVVEWTKEPEMPLGEDDSSFDMREFNRKPRMNKTSAEGSSSGSTSVTTPTVPQVRTVTATQRTSQATALKPEFNFPNFDEDDAMNFSNPPSTGNTATIPTPATSYADYVVKKDDTLQKISKKFYGGYSKWPRIYEANKDILKSPNFIKPGLTLKIPME